MKELLLFQAGTMQLGTSLASVKSIQGAPPIDAKPAEVHNRFASVVNDADFPLYDLVSMLGDKNSSTDQQDEKLIVVKTQDQPVGMIVDRVDRVVTVDSDRIERLSPIFKGPAQSCFPNVLKHEDKLVLLLAPDGIVEFVQDMQRLQDLKDGFDFEKGVEIRSEAESAISSINPEEEPAAACKLLETVLPPAEMEVGLDLPAPDMQTALSAENVESKANLPPVDMKKELEVAATEIDTQMPSSGGCCEQGGDLAHVQRIVSSKLPGDQRTPQVEEVAAKMVKKTKLAGTVRRIVNHAVEDICSKVMK